MPSLKQKEIDQLITKVLHDKLMRYVSGRITSELTRFHHTKNKETTPKKELKEETSTNCIGTSSSTSGSGSIDTVDPLLSIKKKISKRLLDNFNNRKS